MEYFVLNEHSFNLEGDSSYANSCLVTLFDVYREAVSKDFRQIRVTENVDSNWYEIDMGNQYTVRNWIDNQTEKDYKIRLKSLISSTTTPVFRVDDFEKKNKHTFSEFKYKGIDVPVLGATFLLNQLSLSINSNQIWCSSSFSLNCLELNEDGFCESNAYVKNVTTLDHWNENFELISDYRTSLAKNKEEREVLIGRLSEVLFTQKALKDILTANHEFFIEIFTNLQTINDVIKIANKEHAELSYQRLKEDCLELNISDESDSVKNNPNFSKHRSFMFEGERYFFGHHIKKFKGSKRVHFIISNNKVVIGYAGKHLPTQKDPK